MSVLSAAITSYVPKYAMLPCTEALFSSGVPVVRLLEANFGMSTRVMMTATRLLLVNITVPFAPEPKGSDLVPPWSRTLDASVHVPTSCLSSEVVFWLSPARATNAASANAASAASTVLQIVFMAFLPWPRARAPRPDGFQHARTKMASGPTARKGRAAAAFSCSGSRADLHQQCPDGRGGTDLSLSPQPDAKEVHVLHGVWRIGSASLRLPPAS